jgi:hypothetical protein
MMFENRMGCHEWRSVAVRVGDRERRRTRAAGASLTQVPANGLQVVTWWKGVLREAAAMFPIRMKGTLTIRRKALAQIEQAMKLVPRGIDQWVGPIAVLSLLLSTGGGFLFAAPSGGQPAHLNALELVKDVVRNEKKAREHPSNYYKFVQKETTPKGTKTSIRIETSKGEIGVTVSADGKPPSQSQCQRDDGSLRKLATDSGLQQRQSRELEEENERVDRLMAAIPKAFIFRYKGKQQGGKPWEITFCPDPNFQPQSRETTLLKGMQGTLWVDPASHRLVKIEGTLIKSVNFGWGFLASVQPGGRFALQQSKVAGGSWKATFLKVDLDGRKLIFGQLHVHFKDRSHSFVPFMNPPSLAEAVNMLEHSATACREGKDHRTTAQAQLH